MSNVEIEVDAGAARFFWTDAEPDGERVFATLGEAKRAAMKQAATERDEWAHAVRLARLTTRWDVL